MKPRDNTWMDRAACRGLPLILFFPERPAPHAREAHLRRCPVVAQCRAIAQPDGIWAASPTGNGNASAAARRITPRGGAMRIEGIDDGAIRAAVGEGFGKVARERLGPEIRDAAKMYCPVDTGALRDSITDSYDEGTQTLYVTATGSEERTRAYGRNWVIKYFTQVPE